MMSIVILAGGKSQRMGRDKAFLNYKRKSFIAIVADQALRISNDVLVVVGNKEKGKFERILGKKVSVLNDAYELENPLGGLLTGLEKVKNPYAAVVACDTPLIKSDLLQFLFQKARGHSAAVPRWGDGSLESLVAVYRVEEAKNATLKVIKKGLLGPKNMIADLSDTCFVPVSDLKEIDPKLESFLNINSRSDYSKLGKKVRSNTSRSALS